MIEPKDEEDWFPPSPEWPESIRVFDTDKNSCWGLATECPVSGPINEIRNQ